MYKLALFVTLLACKSSQPGEKQPAREQPGEQTQSRIRPLANVKQPSEKSSNSPAPPLVDIDEDDARLARYLVLRALNDEMMLRDEWKPLAASGKRNEVAEVVFDDCRSSDSVSKLLNAVVWEKDVREVLGEHGFETLHCAEFDLDSLEVSRTLKRWDLRGKVNPAKLNLDSTRKSTARLLEALWADTPETVGFAPFTVVVGQNKTLVVNTVKCDSWAVLDTVIKLWGDNAVFGFHTYSCMTDGKVVDSRAIPRFQNGQR